ncbi:hypothetical protein B0H11DRAFT_582423 [Mycena galericulata]|nr:hypothetical protein B0H11DRAFT_582423 [Mycena galericulata]
MLDLLAAALGLVTPDRTMAGRDMVGAFLEILTDGGDNDEGAYEWVRMLLQPSLAIAREFNRPRIEKLHSGKHRLNTAPQTVTSVDSLLKLTLPEDGAPPRKRARAEPPSSPAFAPIATASRRPSSSLRASRLPQPAREPRFHPVTVFSASYRR